MEPCIYMVSPKIYTHTLIIIERQCLLKYILFSTLRYPLWKCGHILWDKLYITMRMNFSYKWKSTWDLVFIIWTDVGSFSECQKVTSYLKGKMICLRKAQFTVNWSDNRIMYAGKVLVKNFAFRNGKKVWNQKPIMSLF